MGDLRIVKVLTPEQVPIAINTVRQCEDLNDLVWTFLFKREVTPKRLTEGIDRLFPYLCDAGYLKSIGAEVDSNRPDKLYLGEGQKTQQFEKLFEVPLTKIYFYANPNAQIDYSKIVEAGLVDAMARMPPNTDQTPELNIFGYPERYVMHVADNRFSTKSERCCLRLAELLENI